MKHTIFGFVFACSCSSLPNDQTHTHVRRLFKYLCVKNAYILVFNEFRNNVFEHFAILIRNRFEHIVSCICECKYIATLWAHIARTAVGHIAIVAPTCHPNSIRQTPGLDPKLLQLHCTWELNVAPHKPRPTHM